MARLRPGEPVAGWRLGAVDFLSGRLGVALTAPQVPCLVRPGPGRGRQVQVQPQPVLLAVTSDGGRHWTTQGESLTSSPQSEVAEQVVATSAQDAWALSDTGTLRSTGDRGVTWALPPLPRPVVALASGPGPTAAAPLWALSCPPSGQGSCTPVLDRKLTPAGRWQRLPVPALAAQPPPHLAVLSAGTVVLLLTQASDGRPLLVSSTDSGQHWTTRPAPAGPGHLCASDTSISAAGPDDWLLLCAGGFAAGSSTKALLRSTDAGRSWVTLSAVRSLTVPPRPGSLPVSDALVLTAGSATRLWLALPNGAATSTDGGRTWSGVAGVRPQGWVAALDVRSATMAWLLAPGAGLWQTTDGDTWRLLGAAFRYR